MYSDYPVHDPTFLNVQMLQRILLQEGQVQSALDNFHLNYSRLNYGNVL